MGLEAITRVTVDGTEAEAKVLLESDELIVRSPHRLRVPLTEARDVTVERGVLSLRWGSRKIAIVLGREVGKWAEKMRNRKSLIDKLGVKAAQKVSVVGSLDPEFLAALERRAVVTHHLRRDSEIVFLVLSRREELVNLRRARNAILPNGTVWVIRPKGSDAITEGEIRAAGRGCELVDVKVVRFSETLTAEKFMIPVTKR